MDQRTLQDVKRSIKTRPKPVNAKPRLYSPKYLVQPKTKFVPTDDQRKAVALMVSGGLPQKSIARLVINPNTKRPISVATLVKEFSYELETGHDSIAAEVNKTAYERARGSDAVYSEDGKLLRPASLPSDTMIIWWEKTRRGFKEGTVIEHTGPGGGPIQHQTTVIVLPPNSRDIKLTDQTPRQIQSQPVIDVSPEPNSSTT